MSPTRYLAPWFILAGMVSKGSRSIKFRSTKASGEGFETVLARSRWGDLPTVLLPESGEVPVVEDDGVLTSAFAAPGEFFAVDTFPPSGDFELDWFRKASTCLKRFWRLLSLAICALASAVNLPLALPLALP